MTAAFHSPEDDHALETISEDVENVKGAELPPLDFQDPITSTPIRPTPISPPKKKKQNNKTAYENVTIHHAPLAPSSAQQSSGMLNLHDLKRLQKKHKEAIKKSTSSPKNDKKTRNAFRVRTLKTILFAAYCAFTLTIIIAGIVLFSIGIFYSLKSCLITGTLFLFTSFGLCANHCFNQNAGQAREQTLEEKLVVQEEYKIIQAATDRQSICHPMNTTHHMSVSQQSLNSQVQDCHAVKESSPASTAMEAVKASAVDNIISRRLSTSMGLYADPAAKMIMMHGSGRSSARRASMMHLARSMSMAHHDPWLYGMGRCDDYSEFA